MHLQVVILDSQFGPRAGHSPGEALRCFIYSKYKAVCPISDRVAEPNPLRMKPHFTHHARPMTEMRHNMPPRKHWMACLAVPFGALLGALPCGAADQAGNGRDNALLIYAGKLTGDPWYQSFGPGSHFLDSNILVAALSHTLGRSPDRRYSWEIEGQIGRHSGIQDHTEFNLLAGVRRHRLPWTSTLNSSVGVGLGLSRASEIPRAEATLIKDASEKLLAYWHIDLTLGPPHDDWQAMLRLHHRSTAYGLFGDSGRSNALTLGVRFDFD